MDTFHALLGAILVLVILYALAIVARRRGVLEADHSLVLARIVTDLCLPAIVFVTLAGRMVHLAELGPSLAMLGLELAFIALAWGLSAWLGFSRDKQGAIVFCSAFGSSTFLGYAIITQMFPEQPDALAEAVLISEIGVGYPIFILGPMLAAHFGSDASRRGSAWMSSLVFFRSPVFFALLLGMAWGPLGLPTEKNAWLAPLFQTCHVLSAALTPMAILAVGLMFRMPNLRSILPALGIVVLLKLVLKPLAAHGLGTMLGFPDLWTTVLVLLAAMPPAVLGAVFLRRYGGNASLASALLLVATILSCGSLLGIFWLVG